MTIRVLLQSLITLCLLSTLPAAAFAEIQKFVYVYDHTGEILLPKNAADQCPDPAGGSTAASVCHGVLVDDNGNYSVRLDSKKLSIDNLVLIANEYELISAGTSGNTEDTYALVNTKRRIDAIEKDATNNGVNINDISEATVQAVEKVKHVPKGKKGHIIAELASVIKDIAAGALNHAMGNSQSDNTPSGQTEQRVNDYVAAQQERLEQSQQELLVSLAEAALENEDNQQAQSLIRKNVVQGLVEPATLEEVATRVFSHISDLQITDPSAPLMVLEADKYLVYFDETAELSTANSINANAFFAYTWQGVQSETSSATFSKPEKGSYLICATGEIDNSNDSSTDCIRIAVKDQVEAVARASRLRVGTGNNIKLSASLSIGAQAYSWTGSGTFSDANAEVTEWTAPQVPGTYDIALGVNNNEDTDSLTVEVFDVLPLAVAEASPYVVYLRDLSASSTLSSGSISTDGSAVDSLQWSVIDYPQGAQATIADPAARITQFTTNIPGDYTIQLLATRRGHTDSTEINIQVRDPEKPRADAGEDQIAYRNQAVLLDGRRSYAAEGKALAYLWSTNGATLNSPTQPQTYFITDTLDTYNVTLDVDDGLLSDSDSVTVTVVNRAPSASDDVYANLLNTILYGQLIAMDPDNDSITFSLVQKPTAGGVTIDPITGEFVYVPGGIKGCKYHPYTRPEDNDKGGKDVPVIKLCADRYVIAPGETVNLTASNSINASQFSGYEWLGGAVGDPNDIRDATYTGTTEGLHQVCVKGNIGQSNNTSTACVDIIVNPNLSQIDDDVQTGFVDVFHYEVTDGDKNSKPGIIIITIGWENTPAEVVDLAITTLEDTATSGQLQGSDLDGHDITFSIVDNASIGTVTLNDATTGTFSYTPNPNAYGVDTFTYVAHDGFENSAIGTVTITVENTNDAPVAHFAGILTTLEDNAVSGTLGATDPDEEDVMDFRLATLPAKGEVIITNAQTGAFTYTPHQDLNGSDSFFFVVHDGTLESNAAKVDIEITPVNDAPVTENVGPLTTFSDESLRGELSASDVDNDALIYKIHSQPGKGTVSLDAVSGDYIYTPNGSDLGADSFTYSASDAFVSSNVSTVSINVLQANLAPVCNQVGPISVFEGVPYGGSLSCSDPDGGSLTYIIVDKGHAGSAAFTDSSTGEYIYTPNPLASGSDYFTFKASDGKKESAPVTVLVELVDACAGPGNDKRDNDGDGYADLVELEFGTLINDANSNPFAQISGGATVSFTTDDDGDGYSDIAELWLLSDYKDVGSMPSESTLKGVPRCLTAIFDTIPPALFAFNILTPTVDATSGTAKARFSLTGFDGAAGISEISIVVKSPSGEKVNGKANYSDKPVAAFVEFESDTFNQYAESGVWTVATLGIKDANGSQLLLNTEDLAGRGYPTTLQVTGLIASPPQLVSFQILTPSVNICNGDVASVQIQSTDDVGVARAAVVLRSPSGETFNWAELAAANPGTSWTATINNFAYRIFPEPGTWQISELRITDTHDRLLTLDTAGLLSLGYAASIEVTGCEPPELVLNNFTILTSDVTNANAQFEVDVSSSIGISAVKLLLQHGTSQPLELPAYSAMDVPTNLVHILQSGDFNACVDNGYWKVHSLVVRDALGNQSSWSTQNLLDLGFATDFSVDLPVPEICSHIPSAYATSFQTDEDTQFSGRLLGYDSFNHAITYHVVKQPASGTVSITNAATGDFVFTPVANAYGGDSFTFKVNDGAEDSNIATVTITVNPLPDPTIIEDLSITVEQDTTYVGQVNASDADRLPLTYEIVSNGQLGTATFLTNNTFQYVPNPGVTGSDLFTFQVRDDNTVSRTGTVNINIISNAPLPGGFTFTPTRVSSCLSSVRIEVEVPHNRSNSEYSNVQLTLQGPSGQVIGFSATPSGSGNIFKLVNVIQTSAISGGFEPGLWTFRNLLAKRKGEIYSQIVMSDIEAAGFAATMEVVENCPPVAHNQNITAPVNEIYSGTLSATDPEGDPLTFRIVNNVTHGIVTLVNPSTGAFTYAPTSLDNDEIRFVANDGLSDSSEGIITVDIIPTPQCPNAFPLTINVAHGTVFEGVLNAEDASGNPLTYTIVSGPSSGNITVTDSSTGHFRYFPNPNFTSDSFTYTASNGICDSQPAEVIVKKSSAPICESDSIAVLKNVPHSGAVACGDPEDDVLTYYLVSDGTRGTVSLNPVTGNYTYTPVTNSVGPDYFVINASDGVHTSNEAIIAVNIIGSCPTGGVFRTLDSDADGYVDFIEIAVGTDPYSATSTPAQIEPLPPMASFVDDDDSDGHTDYIELWMQSDPLDEASVPEYVFDTCFDPTSDGIKPRLIGFNIDTPIVDLRNGDAAVTYSMTVLDNASGIKRARVSLLSPTGVFVTTSVSFGDYPLLKAFALSTDPLSQFAEEGVWEISGITLFDEAANRLDISTDDLLDAGYSTTVEVVNLNSDTAPPTLDDFTIITSDIVYAGTEDKRMSVSLTLSDNSSGVASARVDFISASGTVVSASKTLAENPTTTTMQLDTNILSSHLEEGIWTVHSVLLVDAAGNSTQVVDELTNRGFSNTLSVTNPNTDSVAPTLESFSVLIPEVYPLSGDAKMSFAATAYDTAININGNDPAGIAKIRIDITGPAGQIYTAWSYFSAPYPSATTVQIDSATLSSLSQEGTWYVTSVEVFDDAGNSTLYDQNSLSGYPTAIFVSH